MPFVNPVIVFVRPWALLVGVPHVPDAHSFEWRQRTGTGTWGTPTSNAHGRTKTITGLTNGTLYGFQVRAKWGTVTSPWSAEQTATPQSATAALWYTAVRETDTNFTATDFESGESAPNGDSMLIPTFTRFEVQMGIAYPDSEGDATGFYSPATDTINQLDALRKGATTFTINGTLYRWYYIFGGVYSTVAGDTIRVTT